MPLQNPSSNTEIMLEPEEFLPMALLSRVMAVDTETTGKDIRDGRGYCVGISTAIQRGGIYYHSYFPVAHHVGNISDDVKERLFQIIGTRVICMHHAKFDLESLSTAGYNGKFLKWYCTMMMAHFLNENVASKELDWLAKHELKEPGKVKKNFKPIWKLGMGHMIPVEEMKLYAGIDTVLTLKLFERLYPFFVKAGFDGEGFLQDL